MKKILDHLSTKLKIKLTVELPKLLYFYVCKGGYKYIPPSSLRFVGGGNYLIVGNDLFILFKELTGIRPDDKILEVGCGTGRISVPLIRYLSDEGEYHGFDIVKSGIDWCRETISAKHPNFHYLHADIYNTAYNPEGTIDPADYRFPYEDESFDFVFLTSVFTHMRTGDIQRYLNEIARVLKKDGKCFITYFLINDESKALISKGLSSQNISFQIDEDTFTNNPDVPETAIGVTEEFVRKAYDAANLKITEPIYFGGWSGRRNAKNGQDIIIATRSDRRITPPPTNL